MIYVFYFKRNYETSPLGASTAGVGFTKTHTRLLQLLETNQASMRMSKQDIQMYKNILKAMSGKDLQSKYGDVVQQYHKFMQEKFNQTGNLIIGKNFDVKFDAGGAPHIKAGVGKLQGLQQHSDNGYMFVKTLAARAAAINGIMEIIAARGGTAPNLQQIQKQAKLFNQALSSIFTEVVPSAPQTIKNFIEANLKNNQRVMLLDNKQAIEQAIQSFNSIIDLCNRGGFVSGIKGQMFEDALVMAGQYLAKTVASSVIKAVQGTGGNRLRMQGKQQFVIADSLLNTANKDLDSIRTRVFRGGAKAQTQAVQGKVDVVLSDQSGNSVAKISAKNYNLSKNGIGQVHLVQHSLDTFLGQLEDGMVNFILNHMTALHAGLTKPKNRQAKIADIQPIPQAYYNMVKTQMLYTAMAGGRSNLGVQGGNGTVVDDNANLMVINNNAGGQIYIFSIATFIKNVFLNEGLWDSLVSFKPSVQSVLRSKALTNKWYPDPPQPDMGAARIRTMQNIAQLHSQKISCSLKVSGHEKWGDIGS